MIVVPLGAHLGVFSVLPRLRSVVLTSLPALSCQYPLPRSKRLALLPWAASVPGAESKKTQIYHVYPTLRKPNSCYANVHCLGVFFLCLPSSSYRVWRFLCLFAIDVVVIAFLDRDVCSLFCVGAGCLVWFSSWFVCSVLRECVSSGHFLYLGLSSMLSFSGVA